MPLEGEVYIREVRPLIDIHLSRRNTARWVVKREQEQGEERGQRAEGMEATRVGNEERVSMLNGADGQNTLPRIRPAAGTLAKKRLLTTETQVRASENSASPVGAVRRRHPIRQEIIGRTCGLRWRGLARRNIGSGRLHALIHQPASQHRRGVLFQVLIEEFANLLTQVGGVSKTGQLVGLQGISRGSKKKLPRWLHRVFGHGDAPKIEQVFNVTVLTNHY